MDDVRMKVAKFRTAVKDILPYMTGYVYGLVAYERPAVQTMAVDEKGRLYYAPEFVAKCSVENGRFTIVHEALHVALGHAPLARKVLGDRPSNAMLRAWNLAADCVVNGILRAYLHQAPGEAVLGSGQQVVTHTALGLPPGLTVTQYYDLLMEQHEQEQERRKQNDPSQRDEGDDDDDEQETDDEDMEGETEDGSDRGDEEREASGDRGDGEPDDGDDGEGGDDEGGEEGDGGDTGQPDHDRDGDAGDEDGGNDGAGSAEDDGEDQEGGGSPVDDADGGGSWSARGGSGADGQPRDYEEAADPAWRDREYEVTSQLEQAIIEQEAAAPGSVPGELKVAVGVRLRPVTDPYDALRASVARAVASSLGMPDFTLRRFSRRQQPDMPRLRGVVKQTPNVVVILDTSGSMCLSQQQNDRAEKAMAVIAKGVRRLSNVRVVCWDTTRHSDAMVKSMSGFVAAGGGGTSMTAAIEAMDAERVDAILVLTDGETAWPEVKPRARTVVALVSDPGAYFPTPAWATVVDLSKGGA